MGNNSHTPGPWHVKWDKYSVYIRSSNPTKDISICKVMTHRNYNNLNILIHAPEMLTVLENLSKLWDNSQSAELADTITEAKHVISKVRGETNA
jgi:hypothetical protein